MSTCPECGAQTTPVKTPQGVSARCSVCGAVEVLCPENWPDLPCDLKCEDEET